MNEVAVSLILCTRNRAEQLSQCLARIARVKSRATWELIIVDNGSRDATAQVIRAFAQNVDFPVRLIHEQQPGKSRALNRAVGESAGQLVAFVDDDCYVTPDHIDRVEEAFSDPKIGFVGGRVELHDQTDYPISIRTSSAFEFYPPRTYIEGGLLLGANMAFRRSALNAVGGFDPDFGPGTPLIAEDTDIQVRASLAGWWGAYTPNVVVAHHHGRKIKDAEQLSRKYCNGSGALHLKFLLVGDARQLVLRAFYWYLVGVLRKRYPVKSLFWELEGAARYGIRRTRHLLGSSRREYA